MHILSLKYPAANLPPSKPNVDAIYNKVAVRLRKMMFPNFICNKIVDVLYKLFYHHDYFDFFRAQ